MNKHIVCFALRRLILESGYSITDSDREDAITELIRIEREDAARVNTAEITGEQMRSFREYRKDNGRIQTIKMIRSVLNIGLAEALIIVKGIESHDNIIT